MVTPNGCIFNEVYVRLLARHLEQVEHFPGSMTLGTDTIVSQFGAGSSLGCEYGVLQLRGANAPWDRIEYHYRSVSEIVFPGRSAESPQYAWVSLLAEKDDNGSIQETLNRWRRAPVAEFETLYVVEIIDEDSRFFPLGIDGRCF
ncbi:MAG: hypothetical protein A2289_20325 [Deltaproteobacteria bacterium RIFOXYA12_FULL_58_15]|nr:MAG: hypothetical protein A2289_20325 [Deltaproteobacteria bacterium RIFOXYA12_FULL_58_15]